MAVVKAGSEPKKSMVIAMALLVVLFLAAASAAVVMFLGRAQLVSERDTAQSALNRIANASEQAEVRGMAEGQDSALKRVTADMQEVVGVITGEAVSGTGLSGLKGVVEARTGPLFTELNTALVQWQQQALAIKKAEIGRLVITNRDVDEASLEAKIQPLDLFGPQEMAREQGLLNIVRAFIDQTNYLMQQLYSAKTEARNDASMHQIELAGIAERVAALTVEKNQSDQAAKLLSDQYESIVMEKEEEKVREIESLEAQITKLQEAEQTLRQENATLSNELDDARVQIRAYRDRLQQFQPAPEMEMAAFELDGVVTEVVPQERTAYINLGRNDHIYRGLTFTVYDRYQPFPNRETGQGIGTLEVIEIMNTISRCRIVDFSEANPIMKNDVIANVVWSRDKKYSFCVTGDFDFNGDGVVDADGYNQIVRLIEQWGGVVTSAVSVNTDFMVVGQEPVVSDQSGSEYTTVSSEELRLQFEREQARVMEYLTNMGRGASLGVPTFNRDRFLYFIGYYSQAKGGR